MKKAVIAIIAVLLALLIGLIGFFLVFNKGCNKENNDGVNYELSEDGDSYTATGLDVSKSGNVVIPDTYNGMPVNYIEENAFKDNTTIKSVTISASVKHIYSGAFKGCTNLTKFVLKGNETVIERDALEGTPVYEDESNWDGDVFYLGTMLIWAKTTISGSYTVREGTTSISGYAFAKCTLLTSITVSVSVTFIGDYAFSGCEKLADITLPEDGINYIGIYVFINTAFFENSGNWSEGALYVGKYLISVKITVTGTFTIKEGTLVIAGGAFMHCEGLTEIIIPDGVISIGVNAFAYCINITIIIIPGSVTYVGIGVFMYCTALVTITVNGGNSFYYSEGNCLIEKSSKTLIAGCKTSVIPNGIKCIQIGAFAGCEGLVSITIPSSVTFIGTYAFADCKNLKTINVPDGVKFIASYTFSGCVSLTTVNLPDGIISLGSGAFEGCTCLIEIIIPDSVTYIASGVFAQCTSLVTVKISINVTFIGDHAFDGCVSLIKIIYLGTEVQWKIIVKGYYWDAGTGDFELEFTGGSGEDSIYGTYKFAYFTSGGVTVKSGEQGYSDDTLVLVFNENGTFTITATSPATIIDAGSSLSGTWTLSGNYVLVAEGRVLTDVGIIDGNTFTILVNAGAATIGLRYAG